MKKLSLLILTALATVAAPPPSPPSRSEIIIAAARCKQCHSTNQVFISLETITNVITAGTNAPRGSIERYWFTCPNCKTTWRHNQLIP